MSTPLVVGCRTLKLDLVQELDMRTSPASCISPLLSDSSHPVCDHWPTSSPHGGRAVSLELDTPASWQLHAQQHQKHRARPPCSSGADDFAPSPLHVAAMLRTKSTPAILQSALVSDDTSPANRGAFYSTMRSMCSPLTRLQHPCDRNPTPSDPLLSSLPPQTRKTSGSPRDFKHLLQSASSPPRALSMPLQDLSEPCDSLGYHTSPQHCSLNAYKWQDSQEARQPCSLARLPSQDHLRICYEGKFAQPSNSSSLETPVGGRSVFHEYRLLESSEQDPMQWCPSGAADSLQTLAVFLHI